jgi:hypothetical protein
VEKGGRKKYITEKMEEAPENSKELSNYAHANGMNEFMNPIFFVSRKDK